MSIKTTNPALVIGSVVDGTVNVGTSLPDSSVNTSYNVEIKTNTNHGGNCTFSLAGNAVLPAGLALVEETSLDGVKSSFIRGTPEVAGAFNTTVNVINDLGSTGSKTFTVRIGAIEITTGSVQNSFGYLLPEGKVSLPYNVQLAHNIANPVLPMKWIIQSGALPLGLALDPVTGVISGTPDETSEGISNFTVKVYAEGGTAEQFATKMFD